MNKKIFQKIILFSIIAITILCTSSFATISIEDSLKLASSSVNEIEETAEDINSHLKSLSIDGYEIYPEFNRNTTKYYLSIPSDVESVDVNAEPEVEDAKVRISGDDDFSMGANEITITVTSKSGRTTKYTINAVMSEDSGPKLKNLTVEGATLSPEFSNDKHLYRVTMELIKVDKIEPLKIETITEDEDTKVEIIGNTDLKEGENLITILLEYDDEYTTYQIIADISSKVAVTLKQEQDDFFTKTANAVIEFAKKLFDTEQKRIAFAVAGGVVIGIAIIIIINVIHKKTKARKNKEQIKKRVRWTGGK